MPQEHNKPKRERVRLYDEDLPFGAQGKRPRSERVSPDGPTRRQQEFVHRYLARYRNGELAAIDIGIPARRAYGVAAEYLRKPEVQAYIKECELESLRRLNLDVDLVIKGQYIRATTPVTECFDVMYPPCRYCWGTNNEYQRTHDEMECDIEKYQDAQRRWRLSCSDPANPNRKELSKQPPPFDEKGGIGYDYCAEANPDCPNCHGDPMSAGVKPVVKLKDTRHMSLAGKMLLSGMTIKDGQPVMTLRDADAASSQFMATFRDMWELSRAGDRGEVPVLDLRARGPSGMRMITTVTRKIIHVEKVED